MEDFHRKFLDYMSIAISYYSVDFTDFSRQRGYRDFKLDMVEIDSARELAALALCTLRNGDNGSMDAAVVYAAVMLLEDELGARTGTPQARFDNAMNTPHDDRSACRQWANTNYP